MTESPAPPGWYDVPSIPGHEAFWDGSQWVESSLRPKSAVMAPVEQSPQPAPSTPTQSAPTDAASTVQNSALESKGFFRSLYDFSFSSFITLRVIRVLYVLITIILSLGAAVLFFVLVARHTPASIAVALIGVPLGYLVYLIVARIYLELMMVIFNIGKDVRGLRERAEASGG